MPGKKTSQYTNLLSLQDATNFVLNWNGENYNVAYSVLKALITSALSGLQRQVCAAGTTTNINLGDSTIYRGFNIDYIANVGETKGQAGLIKVMQIGSTQVAGEGGAPIPIPIDASSLIDMTYSADVSSGQLRLKITNNETSSIIFQYTKTAYNINA